jgi:hypothetical protein
MRRLLRCLLFVLLALFVLVASGLLLADHLTPQSMGQPGHALPVQPAQTAIDRMLAPELARRPANPASASSPPAWTPLPCAR